MQSCFWTFYADIYGCTKGGEQDHNSSQDLTQTKHLVSVHTSGGEKLDHP